MFRRMPFSYVSVEDAIARPGLRMVVVGNVPSPWGEAAKGIFHVKKLEWSAVRLAYDSEPLKDWAGGQRNGPVAIYDKEKPRSGWAEILLLAERLAPAPALLPSDAAQRALAFGLCHELLGEAGLAWSRRLQLIDAGLHGREGFAPRVAQYLGKKYGYTPELGAAAPARVAELLRMLSARLRAQHAAGSRYYLGDTLTAVDIYAATAMALLRPLPEAQCAMDPSTRTAFESRDATIDAALDPVLLEHRDMLYREHLALPLSL
jgi:glutathione S-transferase